MRIETVSDPLFPSSTLDTDAHTRTYTRTHSLSHGDYDMESPRHDTQAPACMGDRGPHTHRTGIRILTTSDLTLYVTL